MIEPQYKEPFDAWKADPSPDNNAAMLSALQPQIEKASSAHLGSAANSPLVRSRARRMTLDALRTYDPSRSRLTTHLYGSLQGLKRYTARQSQGVRIPERMALDRRSLDLAAQELRDEQGREPNDEELADRLGMHPRRIRYVRTYRPAMASGQLDTAGLGDEGGGGYNPAVRGPGADPSDDAWVMAVYGDLDATDKVILEHTLGLNGKTPMGTGRLADRLRLTPGAISQRKAKIQALLDQQGELSPFGG